MEEWSTHQAHALKTTGSNPVPAPAFRSYMNVDKRHFVLSQDGHRIGFIAFKVNPYLISLLSERKCRVVLAATVFFGHCFGMSINTVLSKQEVL